MSPEVNEWLIAFIEDSRDALVASRLHLKYQLSLMPRHRVQQDSDDLIEGEIKKLNIEIQKHEQALNELTKDGTFN